MIRATFSNVRLPDESNLTKKRRSEFGEFEPHSQFAQPQKKTHHSFTEAG
jgi:hypothetical protein